MIFKKKSILVMDLQAISSDAYSFPYFNFTMDFYFGLVSPSNCYFSQ